MRGSLAGDPPGSLADGTAQIVEKRFQRTARLFFLSGHVSGIAPGGGSQRRAAAQDEPENAKQHGKQSARHDGTRRGQWILRVRFSVTCHSPVRPAEEAGGLAADAGSLRAAAKVSTFFGCRACSTTSKAEFSFGADDTGSAVAAAGSLPGEATDGDVAPAMPASGDDPP